MTSRISASGRHDHSLSSREERSLPRDKSSSVYGRVSQERASARTAPYDHSQSSHHQRVASRSYHLHSEGSTSVSSAYNRGVSSRPTRRFNPPQLTSFLKNAALYPRASDRNKSWKEVCTEHLEDFNEINLSTAIHTFAEKWDRLPKEEQTACLQDHQVLIDSIKGKIQRKINGFEGRNLANIAWAFAKLHINDVALFTAISSAAIDKMGSFNAQELANTAWAIATLHINDGALFTAISGAARGKMGSFNAQDLANTAWAFAALGIKDGALFTAISRVARGKMGSFNAQDLASTAWAFATLHIKDVALFTAIRRLAMRKMGSFNAQDLANTAWAFATLNIKDVALFTEISRATMDNMGSLNAQELSNIAWAFATLHIKDVALFTAISRTAVGEMGSFNAQGLANIAWAFAKLHINDGALFTAISRAAMGKMGSLNTQDLANTAWAFAIALPKDALLLHLLPELNQLAGSLNEKESISVHQTILGLQLFRDGFSQDAMKLLPALQEKIDHDLSSSSLQIPRPSRLHQDVMRGFDQLKISYECEVFEHGYFLDIVLKKDGQKIAVEIDGPSHDLNNNGGDWLRQKILEGLGWRVLHISYQDWNSLTTDQAKKGFLRKFLKDSGLAQLVTAGQNARLQELLS